uniref:Cytochrome c oxidase assembly protein COX20, mitochondrial n=1 Tax=Ascaris lumbricoides TaxID=6252 RepID=A0A0M3HM45_ASCLU
MSKLPRHDFAALISYRYAGGLAFVSGMCTSKAVMLCGVSFMSFHVTFSVLIIKRKRIRGFLAFRLLCSLPTF